MKSTLYPKLIALGIVLLGVFAGGSAIAGGKGTVTHFEAISVACGTFEGNGDINRLVVILSEEPRIAGTGQVETTFVGNQVLVNAVFFPDAFEGAWVAPGHSTVITPAPVIHHGHGTGELGGQKIQFRASPQPDLVLEDPPCEDPLNIVILVGTIIDLPNQ
jgi:hypothetical protein